MTTNCSVDDNKAVTWEKWKQTPGPGRAVIIHIVYRRKDADASSQFLENNAKGLIACLNSRTPYNYQTHGDEYVHVGYGAGNVSGFENDDEKLTLPDTGNASFDNFWLEADGH